MTFPSATYRVQLHKDFQISRVREMLPYLQNLGVSHLYISPPFAARAGSTHGYDVVDPSTVNPEIGGEDQFGALAADLHRLGMGLIVDIVPNHMAANSQNGWWTDVLENGVNSRFASFFDVEWSSPHTGAGEKILLPILGKPFGRTLEDRDIRLDIDERGFAIHYYSTRLPVDPRTYGAIVPGAPDSGAALWRCYQSDPDFRAAADRQIELFNGREGDPASMDPLDDLLQNQPYRLAWWQNARERINYRRFFDVSDLIGLRQEDPTVFKETHGRICSWVEDGVASGLRIDHIDGLLDPREYLERLNTACGGKPYIVVEKILLDQETLPEDWKTAGTTGYDFLGMANNLFVDGEALPALGETYARFSGLDWDLAHVAYEQKRWIIRHLFRGETFALGLHLALIAEGDRHGRDLSLRETRKALLEITACLPVYRTYVAGEQVSERDRDVIQRAVEDARRRNPEIDSAAYDFVERVLLLDFPRRLDAERRRQWVRFVMRWQQLTGPIAAKGVEDTSLYLYNRLISMNDVGGQPDAVGIDEFHRFLILRQTHWPGAMNATSTHDTKRSEDVRARLNVLSELPGEWDRRLFRWSRWNRDKKTDPKAPDGNEETLLYQTMLGAWPLFESEVPEFVDRLKKYVVKAVREGKVYSSWLKPNEEHEAAIHQFIDRILDPGQSGRFIENFTSMAQQLAWHGALNSLSQTILKITAPGVPDFYQGTEFWDFSLVDPDNRRLVNVGTRLEIEREMDSWTARDLLSNWRDGRIKAFVIRRALANRIAGDYIPVRATNEHAVAFARSEGAHWTLSVVPRFTTRLGGVGKPPVGRRAWKDVSVEMPPGAPSRWLNVFTGEVVQTPALADILRTFPMALLVNQ